MWLLFIVMRRMKKKELRAVTPEAQDNKRSSAWQVASSLHQVLAGVVKTSVRRKECRMGETPSSAQREGELLAKRSNKGFHVLRNGGSAGLQET